MQPGQQKLIEPDLRPGSLFAQRYRIGERRSADNVSSVCNAEDVETGAAVTLRLLRPEVSQNTKAFEEFGRQMELFRQHPHEGLVRVLAFEKWNNFQYVVTEYPGGQTLDDVRIKSKRLTLEKVIPIIDRVCDILSFLHSHGLIYGQLCARSVIVPENGGRLLLMEPVLAQDLRQATVRAPSGLHSYYAPEQILERPLSPATDVFALGELAFELLTGKPPYADGPLLDRCSAPPPPFPQEITATPVAAAVLRKCLDPDPARRFQSAQQVHAALDPVREQIAVSQGRTRLETLIGREAGDPDKAVVLFSATVARLQQIHAAGNSHAELTPRNIWKTKSGAIEIDSGSASAPHATVIITDPKYIAPEFCLAQSAPDAAAHDLGDIYVLGFLFYEVLVGRQEFEKQFAELEQAQSGFGWLSWHADKSKQVRPLAEAAPACPRPLSDLVQRMLVKEATGRIQTLEEVASSLGRLGQRMEDTHEFAIPGTTAAVPGKKSHGALWLFLLLLTAFALGGAWWILSQGGISPAYDNVRQLAGSAFAYFGGVAGTVSGRPAASVNPPETLITETGPMVLVSTATPPSFYIDRFEVTNRLYKRFCDQTSRNHPLAPVWDSQYFDAKPDHPVVNVSWEDARQYCEFAGKRLPAESEWQAAAAGSGKTVWANWTVPGIANLEGSDYAGPAPAGLFRSDSSPFGARDMAGNVQEWVADDYVTNGTTPQSVRKVIKGGSFLWKPPGLSPEWRGSHTPDIDPSERVAIGFRCAAPVDKGPKLARVR